MNKRFAGLTALMIAGFVVTGCTDETGDESEGHLLEAQQQALERARNVEDDIAAAAERRSRQIDEAEKDN